MLAYIVVVKNSTLRFKNLPKAVIVDLDHNKRIIKLYDEEENKSIKEILKAISSLKQLFQKCVDKDIKIVVPNFKSVIQALNIELDRREYEIYDMHDYRTVESIDNGLLLLEELKQKKTQKYQKLLANSCVVYQDLEIQGLMYNHVLVKPIWSQDTYSGRSKSSGFNIQGFNDPANIRTISALDTDVLVHFDWICADIRVASLLSGDKLLASSFNGSDPYTLLMHRLNDLGNEKSLKFSRDECKLILLKSINSMNLRSVVFKEVFSELGCWINSVAAGEVSRSILGREFSIQDGKTQLSILNGAMQGSVAHAMQSVMRRVWLKFPSRIVAEVHDSIVLTASRDLQDLRPLIKIVGEIMLNPFDDGRLFPIKVSIGSKWKKYKHYATIYNLEQLDVL